MAAVRAGMQGVPGELDTDAQPPLTIPLRHFLVGLAFLLGAGVVWTWIALGAGSPTADLVSVHLLLVGWVAITIMGAMTQFVPVWTGRALHSRRLAVAQLWLVAGGLLGFLGALAAGRPALLFVPGIVLLAGFWGFAYNVYRTMGDGGPWDVTERHFRFALACFVLLTVLGYGLSVDLAVPVLRPLGLGRANVVAAHASVAVYGALTATVIGALYQLGPMFTQTELSPVESRLQSLEDRAYPVGVLALAGGRLVGHEPLAAAGGVLVAASVFAVGLVLGRRLAAARVPWSPMLVRYAVAAAAMLGWGLVTVPAWLARPLARDTLYGGAGGRSLFVLGVLGFVVMGTLYHVVPFVIWLHRYSDRIGLEPVPMIDDLYSRRLARADLAAVLAGTVGLVLADLLALPGPVAVGGAALVAIGFGLFSLNLLLVIRDHSPLRRVLFGRSDGTAAPDA